MGGLGFGLACLCRPSLMPGVILTGLIGIVVGPGSLAARLSRSSLLIFGMIAALGPWIYRNIQVFGEPIATTTHGGYTLALANNPAYYADVLNGPGIVVWSGANQDAWFAGVGPATAGMTEPESDRTLRGIALRFTRDRPRDFLRASMARLGRFWGGRAIGIGLSRLAPAGDGRLDDSALGCPGGGGWSEAVSGGGPRSPRR